MAEMAMPVERLPRLNFTDVDGYLIVAFPEVISDVTLATYRHQISRVVERARHRGVIINLAAVTLLDYGALKQIRRICQSNALLGSTTVLLGARPSIAAYLAGVPDGMDDLIFCSDMESAKLSCG
jgi:rsbT antagonist protein RsbS